jgi:hypothetical protein
MKHRRAGCEPCHYCLLSFLCIATPQMGRKVAAGEIGDLLLPTEKPDVSGFSYDVAIHCL